MSGEWSRVDDATIARLAEGLEVVTCKTMCCALNITFHRHQEFYLESGGDAWAKGIDGEYNPVPTYLTDLPAVVRAAEAWVKQDADYRTWKIERFGGDLIEAGLRICGINAVEFHANADTPEAALAHALLRALTP